MNNDIIEKLMLDINEEELARKQLKYFMIYTDPKADNPDMAYELKEYHKTVIDYLEKVNR